MGKYANGSIILTPSSFKIYVWDDSALYAHAIKFIF